MTFPSIGTVFRSIERQAVNSSSTSTGDKDETIQPIETVTRNHWLLTMQGDRTLYVPAHTGRNIFPSHGLFNRLVRFAHTSPPRLCVRDDNAGTEATHLQLLSDVLALRERVSSTLNRQVREALERQDEVYIAVLAPGGYEYTVAMLAVLALGAAVVPLTTALPPEEAVYFATQSQSAAVLVSSGAVRLGVALEKLLKDRDANSTFSCIPIAPSTFTPALKPTDLVVSSDLYLSDNAPAVVIFTSGTTGPPKGSVMRRAYTFDGALAVADHYSITSSDVLLHVLPVHHATGLGIMFFPFLLSGALTEYKSGPFSSEWTWDRFRAGGITFFSGVPTIYMRMRRHFEEILAHNPDQDEYVKGARALRACICGTSALPQPIANFWTEILGRPILLRYGATEIGAVFKVSPSDRNVPEGSVGKLFASCDVKLLSEYGAYGDEGEVLVRSPEMFSKYLYSPAATQAAHTADGYYRTGDIARREGDYYFILGRASVDIIKSGGYKISALDIEREIMGLPYVAEVMVVGVPDEEFGERVGAVIVLKEGAPSTLQGSLTLERVRLDLRARLAGYKMPTALRVADGELPKSGTGKVVKKVLGPKFFPPAEYMRLPEVQVWRSSKVQRAKL